MMIGRPSWSLGVAALAALALSGCGASASDAASAGVAVEIRPPSAQVQVRGTQAFTAALTGAADTSVVWSVAESGGGTVSAAGLYTAPATQGTYHVVVASHLDPSQKATATVTVTLDPPPVITVTISPRSFSLAVGTTTQFSATVAGSTDTGISWSIQEAPSGGGVSSTGLYTAPQTPGTYHVVASSHANPGSSDSATVSVTPSAGGGGLPWLHVEGNKIKDPHGNVVVLRGISNLDIGTLHYDRPGEGGVAGAIDRVSGAGWYTRVIRLPVYPPVTDPGTGAETRVTHPWPYTLAGWGGQAACDAYFNTVLKPAVDHATAKGLYVIIDYHGINTTNASMPAFGGKPAYTEDALVTDFWTYMAPRFKDNPGVLYEIYGEPVEGSWPSLKPRMQKWVDLIRAVAPNNLILVGNNNYDQHPDTATASPVTGANLVYTAHPYGFHSWSGLWGSGSVITTAAARAPIMLTEWGYDGTNNTFRNGVRTMADANDISWIMWCNDWAWSPTMWTSNAYSTLTDEGTFVKQWLLDKKDANQPVP